MLTLRSGPEKPDDTHRKERCKRKKKWKHLVEKRKKKEKQTRRAKEQRDKQVQLEPHVWVHMPACDRPFRAVFGSQKANSTIIRDSLLSAALQKKIVNTKIINGTSLAEGEEEKEIRGDVACTDDKTLYDIEMQTKVDSLKELMDRCHFYSSKITSCQDEKGMKYSALKPVTLIFFIRQKGVWKGNQAIMHYELVCRETGDVYTKLHIILISIPKAGKMVNGKYVDGLSCDLRNWCLYFEMDINDKDMVQKLGAQTPGILIAYEEYMMSFAAEAYQRYEEDTSAFARGQEDFLLEQRSLKKGKNIGVKIGLDKGVKIGLDKGVKIGFDKGVKEESERKLTKYVLSCKAHGMNAEEIAEYLEEPLAEVKAVLAKNT